MTEAPISLQQFNRLRRYDCRTHIRYLTDHLIQQHPMPVCPLWLTSVNSTGNQLEYALSSRIKTVHIECHAVHVKIVSGMPEPLPSVSDTLSHFFQFRQFGFDTVRQLSEFVIHNSMPSVSTALRRFGGQVSTSARLISNSWLKPVTSATAR